MRESPDVIFVRMGRYDPNERFMPIGNKQRVRHLNAIARASVHRVFERNPAVDH
jgi:hypothetical protein